jgi:DNA-binding beta-propeller fold protein YncE
VDDRQGVPGTLYVVDSANNRVLELSPEGKLLASWGARASGSARFVDPTGVAVDARGNVYVADIGNHRIQRLPP